MYDLGMAGQRWAENNIADAIANDYMDRRARGLSPTAEFGTGGPLAAMAPDPLEHGAARRIREGGGSVSRLPGGYMIQGGGGAGFGPAMGYMGAAAAPAVASNELSPDFGGNGLSWLHNIKSAREEGTLGQVQSMRAAAFADDPAKRENYERNRLAANRATKGWGWASEEEQARRISNARDRYAYDRGIGDPEDMARRQSIENMRAAEQDPRASALASQGPWGLDAARAEASAREAAAIAEARAVENAARYGSMGSGQLETKDWLELIASTAQNLVMSGEAETLAEAQQMAEAMFAGYRPGGGVGQPDPPKPKPKPAGPTSDPKTNEEIAAQHERDVAEYNDRRYRDMQRQAQLMGYPSHLLTSENFMEEYPSWRNRQVIAQTTPLGLFTVGPWLHGMWERMTPEERDYISQEVNGLPGRLLDPLGASLAFGRRLTGGQPLPTGAAADRARRQRAIGYPTGGQPLPQDPLWEQFNRQMRAIMPVPASDRAGR